MLYICPNKQIEIMPRTQTGIIITKIIGQNTFNFNVGEMLTNKGSKKFVFVEQITEWTEEDNEIFGFIMPNTVTGWKFYFDVCTTEFGAINLAGKKLIQNWKNI
jgi:hypothetical protein